MHTNLEFRGLDGLHAQSHAKGLLKRSGRKVVGLS